MAGNLLKADKHVVLYDLVPECIDRLTQNYADNTDIATCPAEVAKACDTVITMLPSNPHVEDCYLHQEHGLLTQARKGTLFIDSSTVDPATSRKVALACEDRQCDMVDAPVSGGVGGAENASLTFMVGGTNDNFARSKEILQMMGEHIVHCGDIGVMEGVPSSRQYTGGFGSNLMKKDLGLAINAAQASQVPLPMGAQAHQLYSLLNIHGKGDKDFSVLYEFIHGTDGGERPSESS